MAVVSAIDSVTSLHPMYSSKGAFENVSFSVPCRGPRPCDSYFEYIDHRLLV